MKTKILFLLMLSFATPITEFAQAGNDEEAFKKTFNAVADTFEKRVKPYLLKFSSNQFNVDSNTPEGKHLIDSYYRIYLQKAEHIRSDIFVNLNSRLLKERVDKSSITDSFIFSYRIQFPGLDYAFFESCEKDLK